MTKKKKKTEKQKTTKKKSQVFNENAFISEDGQIRSNLGVSKNAKILMD